MDPEKFKLSNEGITGESKGLFLGEDGSVSIKKQFYVEVVAHVFLVALSGFLVNSGLFDNFETGILSVSGLREFL